MRTFLHLGSMVILMPNFLFAAGFVILGRAISEGNFFEFLNSLLSDAVWLVGWGLFGIVAFFIAVLIGGFFIRTRWLAALCVSILSIASAVVLIVIGSGPYSFEQWLFFLPGFVSLCISGWLTVQEWPRKTYVRPVINPAFNADEKTVTS